MTNGDFFYALEIMGTKRLRTARSAKSKGNMMPKIALRVCLWLLCSAVNFPFIWAGYRWTEVHDWPLTHSDLRSSRQEALITAAVFSMPGPFAVVVSLMAQFHAGFPGPHVRDWPELCKDAFFDDHGACDAVGR